MILVVQILSKLKQEIGIVLLEHILILEIGVIVELLFKNIYMEKIIIKRFVLLLIVIVFTRCASIPPEFLKSMEKERQGIILLKERHKQSVYELTENWYNERLNRLLFIKQIEIDKITITVDDPNGTGKINVLKKNEMVKIDKQFSEAISLISKIKHELIEGYTDSENWAKLVKLNTINLEMTRSLTELNTAQRKIYSELVGDNIPFPKDFINEKTKEYLGTKSN